MKKKEPGGRRATPIESPFLSLKQVLALVPVSRSTIYVMVNNGEFPKQIKLGKRSMAWSKLEVHQWINSKLGD